MKWLRILREGDVNGTGGGGGSSNAGQGADSSSGAGEAKKEEGSQGTVDQEFEITTPQGTKVKVKASDIIDDKGVPFKNRAAEAQRRAREAEEAAEVNHNRKMDQGSNEEAEQTKPGEYVDPTDGQKYSEEDINRMYMTGEGLKAQRIVLGQINVRKIVNDVTTEKEVKSRIVMKYPDLTNNQSPMFHRVAKYMANNDLYGRPNGLELAAAAVAEQLTDEGVPFTRRKVTDSEGQRNSQTGAGVVRGGSGQKGFEGKFELDAEGLQMAQKLGVSPEKMAARLQKHLSNRVPKGQGE